MEKTTRGGDKKSNFVPIFCESWGSLVVGVV
jgi:hypothetical protein